MRFLAKKAVRWGLVVLILVLIWAGYQVLMERSAGIPEDEQNQALKEDVEGSEELSAMEDISKKEIKIQYLGHASFLVEADELRILMDPFSPQVGYGTLELEADLITVSHEHMDHNYVAAAPDAKVLRGLTSDGLGWEEISYSVGEMSITSIPTYHDKASGKLRGRNSIFIFDLGDIRLVHLGDLGHLLNEGDVEKLLPVDVLLVPMGGHYTIDAMEARQVVEQLVPSVVVPMHYQTKVTRNWPISELDIFLEGEEVVLQKGEKPISFSRDNLPESTEIWVLEPTK
ncbi:MAG: MBL fold metallo-hydrolase [Bacillota bacterium]|nr:MBL fold metallo-hydrolase [Bacillota bacterium]